MAAMTNLIERAVCARDFPDGDPYVRASGKVTSLRTLRRHLLHERGLRREWCHFSGHWKRDVADRDHHTPLDE